MPSRNDSTIDGLRERERIAVELLAQGKTCREISRQLGITERALYNIRRKPIVQRAVYARQQELLDESAGQGINVVGQAVSTLTEIMNNPEARDADRIAASRALMQGAQTYQERKLLERTIADLEAQLYGQTNDKPRNSFSHEDPDPAADALDITPEDGDLR